MTRLPLPPADLLRTVARHRGLLAGGLAAGAMAAGLSVLAPSQPTGVPLVRAARDLAAGQTLTAGDLVFTAVPRSLLPAGALTGPREAIGRILAAPLRTGEPLTDVRLVGARLLNLAAPGRVAVPVRIADAASAALLRAGDHVDVLAAGTAAGAPPYAPTAAVDALVLAVPRPAVEGPDGALVVLAASRTVAARLAAAAVSSRLSVVLREGGGR